MAPLGPLCVLMTVFVFSICHIANGQPPLYQINVTSQINPMDNNMHAVNISANPLVFMGRSYKTLYISNDGFIGLVEKERFNQQMWSATNVSPYVDKPFIAPFYYRGYRVGLNPNYAGHVYYTIRTPKDMYQPSLQVFGQYIQSQAVGSSGFTPTWGIEVTWANVTDQNNPLCISNGNCAVNSFQIMIVSDGPNAYAILNYGQINTQTDKYTQAGFNGGNGTGWVPVSPVGGVASLLAGQSSDTQGRYIFKISSQRIARAGCTTNQGLTQISIYPTYGGMLGGKVIDISGPCFQPQQQIKCMFGRVQTDATYVSQSRVRCAVPRLLARGYMKLKLSTNGQTFPYSADFFSVFPGSVSAGNRLDPKASISDPTWYSLKPQTLTMTWDGSLLTNNSMAMVDINLYGYIETDGQAKYTKLTSLGNTRAQNGQFTLDPNNFKCSGQNCLDYEIGILEVRLQQAFYPQQYRYLSSKVIPLGWYVDQAMTTSYGGNWQKSKCSAWYNSDSQSNAWIQQQPTCPCTMEQAMADFGAWQADVSCNIFASRDNVVNCYYHADAIHCVRSVVPIKTRVCSGGRKVVMGSGNQCCYGGNHQLLYSADTFEGSTPDRYHDLGAAPYNIPGTVPLMSHWLADVISFYYCCLWDKYASCSTYMALRPTTDCVAYTPPNLASVFGQGHVTTFGGITYRMLTPGDFTLLTAGTTVVQGRFQKNIFPTYENNKYITTSFSLGSVVVQTQGTYNQSDIVEIRLAGPTYANTNQKMEVRVNRKYKRFDVPELYWQDFVGVSVVNSDKRQTNSQSNFTVMLANGIGLQIACRNNIMELDISVPSNISVNVSGLFGNMSGNLVTPNGTMMAMIGNNPSLQQLTYFNTNYLNTWAVNTSSGLFRDSNPDIHPSFGPVNLMPTKPAIAYSAVAAQTCGKDPACLFDYSHTGSIRLAQATLAGGVRNAYLASSAQTVRSCGLLNIPSALKDIYNYTLNSTVSISKCGTGSLSGPSMYTCTATSNVTQSWSPAVSSTCGFQTASADVGMIVGVVIAVIFVIVVAAVIAFLAIRKRRASKTRATKYTAKDEHVTTEEPREKSNEYSV